MHSDLCADFVSFVVKSIRMTENEISQLVVDCAFKVHKALGPGLLESAYEECLLFELKKKGLLVEKQKGLPLVYESVKTRCWLQNRYNY